MPESCGCEPLSFHIDRDKCVFPELSIRSRALYDAIQEWGAHIDAHGCYAQNCPTKARLGSDVFRKQLAMRPVLGVN